MPRFGASWYPEFKIDHVMTPATDPAKVDRLFSKLEIFPHNGSHVESGVHFYPDGAEIDAVPLETFVGWACVADLSYKRDLDPVTGDDVDVAVKDVWQRGDRLLIRTDHPLRHLGNDDYWDTPPYLTTSVAEWAKDNGAALVGMDCITEKPGDPAFPVHRAVLAEEIPLLENIGNLHELAEKRVWLFAPPIKVAGVEAAPVRALAIEGWAR
jgi:arylformamidase